MASQTNPPSGLKARRGRRMAFAATALALGLAAAYFAAVYLPQQGEMASLTARNAGIKARAGVVRAFRAKHDDLTQYRRELAARLAKIGKVLPDAGEGVSASDDFRASVTLAAQNSGAMLEKIADRPLLAEAANPIDAIKGLPPGVEADGYELAATGDYFSLREFVRRLEESGQLIAIERWSLKLPDDGGDRLRLELSLAAFRQAAESGQQ